MTAATKRERQKCEIYTRVVGYFRPVDQWNEGKQAEFKDRKTFDQVLGNDSCAC
jgi:ribonucleoside-triphosphate reductase